MTKLVTEETIGPILRELGELGVMAVQVRWPDQVLPDHRLYQPFVREWATFAPWIGDRRIEWMRRRIGERGLKSLIDGDRAWTLISAFQQTRFLAGEVWETGVYQGGSAILLKRLIEDAGAEPGSVPTVLRLLDSFEGLPQPNHPLDLHSGGDFGDTGLDQVMETVGPAPWIDFRKGWIPDSFAGLENQRIRFAHVDVDLFQAVLDSCSFIYPRLTPSGVMVFDDCGLASCPGARAAVDAFFSNRPETPFPLINCQCVVMRLPEAAAPAEA